MTRRLDMTKATGLVRGLVVINDDPENRGRVKVRIPTYHGVPGQSRAWLEDVQLPWAMPGSLLNAGNDVGQRIIPAVGTRVFVMFEDGDLNMPVYFGGIPLLVNEPKLYNAIDDTVLGKGPTIITTDDTMQDFNKKHSQGAQGVLFKSLKGFTIYFDDTDGQETVKIIDQAGQSIKMETMAPIVTRRGTQEVSTVPSKITVQSGDTKLEYNTTEGFVFTVPSSFDLDAENEPN